MKTLRLKVQLGLGVIDMMIVLVIFSLLAALAVPAFTSFVDRAKVTAAIGDIGSISVQIETYRLKHDDQLPASLLELDMGIPMDPWGHEYKYRSVPEAGSGKKSLRMQGGLHPLNTDYDLYSFGGDGPANARTDGTVSSGLIVRAKNGAFVGLVEEF
jgi:general secretion pathway protein G